MSRPQSGRERLLVAAVAYFAEQGVTDTSLRRLAAGIGSSHRMLIHHFRSREGLLTAVVERVEAEQRALLVDVTADTDVDPSVQARRFWKAVTDAALIYGPLFYELSAHAMQGQSHALALRESLVQSWLPPLTALRRRRGYPPARARKLARLDLAVARGLLQDLLLTGDRAAIDRLAKEYTALTDHIH